MRVIVPSVKMEITVGNIISWVFAIFIAGGAVFVLKYQVGDLIQANKALEARFIANQERTDDRFAVLGRQTDARISVVEASLADARVNAAEVRGAIQAIERDIGNINNNVETLRDNFDRFRDRSGFLDVPSDIPHPDLGMR